MLKDKIMFIFKQYKYNDNKISASKNFSFLSIISFVIITRSLKSIIKNKLNENNFDITFSYNISNKKQLILIYKTFKIIKSKKYDLVNINKIDASIFYHLIRNKKNKLFSLIINKIHDNFIKFFDITL